MIVYSIVYQGAAVVAFLIAGVATTSANVLADPSHIRQVGQASLIFANDHDQHLPDATDAHDYARQLALDAGLDDGTMWLVAMDPAVSASLGVVTRVVAPDGKSLNAEFAKSNLSLAVVVGGLTTDMPATTPIAWTRGLQPDGTWAAHAPYGRAGGLIVFLGGNATWQPNLRDPTHQLVRYSDGKPTSDIREALPPGARVDEYKPTRAEIEAWSKAPRYDPRMSRWNRWQDGIFLPGETTVLLGLSFAGVAVVIGAAVLSRLRGRRSGSTLTGRDGFSP